MCLNVYMYVCRYGKLPYDSGVVSSDFVVDGSFCQLPPSTTDNKNTKPKEESGDNDDDDDDDDDVDISKFFVTNFNYLGEIGGYDAILNRIVNHTSSLQEMSSFISILRTGVYVYTSSWAKEFFSNHLIPAISNRLQELSGDDLKVLQDRDVGFLMAMLTDCSALFGHVLNDENDNEDEDDVVFNVHEFVESTKVHLCSTMILSPLLALRIRGCQYMQELMEMTSRREVRERASSSSQRANTTTVTSAYYSRKKKESVAKWLTPPW